MTSMLSLMEEDHILQTGLIFTAPTPPIMEDTTQETKVSTQDRCLDVLEYLNPSFFNA